MSICYLLDGETPPARQNGKRLPCERLYAEKEELQAENAHLWECVQNAEHEESVAWDRVRSSERRNAKLRELVRDMWTCIQTADKSVNAWDECDRCSLWNGNNNHRCKFDVRMRELGVEV